MYRKAMESLLEWKSSPSRKPLLVRGIRQSGKTYLLNQFGQEHYSDVAYFNFEGRESLCSLFDYDLDPDRILLELGLLRKRPIKAEETLIIFDEIQSCPKALTSLKYFQEKAPAYHLACAGSLLGIALSRAGSFPVGKVDFLSLYPMTFEEFLLAHNEELLVQHLAEIKLTEKMADVITDELLRCLKYYYLCGGMPEAVATWLESRDWQAVDRVQQAILDSYELDFAKYAPSKDYPKLTAIWKSIPGQLARENKKFFFGRVQKGMRARQLEDALEWLSDAGLVFKVTKVEKPFIPLSSYADPLFFKLYLADVGLLRKMAGLSIRSLLESDQSYREFKGALTENFVLNELIAQGIKSPHFWRSGNMAELDFLIDLEGLILPIEVKADRRVQSKSLAFYRKNYQPRASVRISAKSLSDQGVTGIPLYLVSQLSRLMREKFSG